MADFLIPAKVVAAHVASCPVVQPVTNYIHTPNWSLFMTSVIAGIVSLAIGFGAGWYVKGRGVTGVQTDINNAKNEVEKVTTAVQSAA